MPDLIEIRTLVDTAQGLEQNQTRPHLGALGVEHVDGPVHHLRRLQSRVIRAAELAREREHQDVVVVGERLVGHVYLVLIRLIFAEVESERDHPDIRPFQHTRGEARGRICNDRRGHSATICRGYNGWPPSLASTSRSSSRDSISSVISWRSTSDSPSPLSSVNTSEPSPTSFLASTSAAWRAPLSTAMRSPSRSPM